MPPSRANRLHLKRTARILFGRIRAFMRFYELIFVIVAENYFKVNIKIKNYGTG
jgi:hypothetical protein